jgi:hypothetical protein
LGLHTYAVVASSDPDAATVHDRAKSLHRSLGHDVLWPMTGYVLIITRIILNRVIALTACG